MYVLGVPTAGSDSDRARCRGWTLPKSRRRSSASNCCSCRSCERSRMYLCRSRECDTNSPILISNASCTSNIQIAQLAEENRTEKSQGCIKCSYNFFRWILNSCQHQVHHSFTVMDTIYSMCCLTVEKIYASLRLTVYLKKIG